MKQKRYTDSQIVNILKESESGIIVSDLCRKYGISSSTFYKWREKYSGMDVSLLTKALKSLKPKIVDLSVCMLIYS